MRPPPLQAYHRLTTCSHVTPLPILHQSRIFAFGIFALTIAFVEQITLPDAFAAASELGSNFALDIGFDDEDGASGSDFADVQGTFHHSQPDVPEKLTGLEFVKQFCVYCASGLVDDKLLECLSVRLQDETRPREADIL